LYLINKILLGMKKYVKTSAVMLGLFIGLCSFEGFIYSSQPPQGYAGADGSYCIDCHNSYPINNGGGSIDITGLPDAGYTPGTTYNFSLTTTHSAADRKKWGFSIEARNAFNQTVGTFGSSNANAAINGSELSHNRAVITPFQSSFTYNNLTWTAPANPTADDQTITFYFVGNAANGTGSTSGDFIYSGSKVISLQSQAPVYTFTGNGNWDNAANWSNNTLPPAILTGNATIIIDPPFGSECVLNIEQHIQNGATFTVKEGKTFTISGDLIMK
jgi:hypothetical protein